MLFLVRRAPHGVSHAVEMLEEVQIAGAFDQEVHVAFLDDGVFQLLPAKNADMERLAEGFNELPDMDAEQLWAEKEALDARGISESELTGPVKVASRAELTALIASMDVVFSG